MQGGILNLGSINRYRLKRLRQELEKVKKNIQYRRLLREEALSNHWAAQVEKNVILDRMWHKSAHICRECCGHFRIREVSDDALNRGICDICGEEKLVADRSGLSLPNSLGR